MNTCILVVVLVMRFSSATRYTIIQIVGSGSDCVSKIIRKQALLNAYLYCNYIRKYM